MKFELWVTGKTYEPWVLLAEAHYLRRCKRYWPLSTTVIPAVRSSAPTDIRAQESARIVARLATAPRAYTILLDERGEQMTSPDFAAYIDKLMTRGGRSVIRFVTGGAFGVDDTVRISVDHSIALSSMTFPHQLVRAVFLEQLYRAFTILRREGYHH